jgi:hypothetical protein
VGRTGARGRIVAGDLHRDSGAHHLGDHAEVATRSEPRSAGALEEARRTWRAEEADEVEAIILFWKRRPDLPNLKGVYFELAIRDAEKAGLLHRRANDAR